MRDQIQRMRTYLASAAFGPFVVRSLIGTGTVRIASMVASFLVGVQLARGLGVNGYGYYGIALSIITIATVPAELGLPALVTREVAANSARGDFPKLFGVLRWSNRLALRMAAMIVAGVAVIGVVLLNTRLPVVGTAVLAGAAMIPLGISARIRGGALQGLHHIVRGQIPDNLLRPLALSLLLFAAHLLNIKVGAPAAMALNGVAAGVAFLFAYTWLRQRMPKRGAGAAVEVGQGWLASTIPLALIDGMRMLQLELTTILLGLVSAPSSVGLFRIAVVTATVAAAPQALLNQTVTPIIARLHASSDRNRLQLLVTYAAWVQTLGVLLLSLPLLLAPGFLLTLVFGEGYAPAANALRLLAIGQVVSAAFGPNVVLLNMTRHERRVTRATTVGLAFNSVAVLLLGGMFGAFGAACGFVASLITWNLLTWRDARRLLSVETSILRLPRMRRS